MHEHLIHHDARVCPVQQCFVSYVHSNKKHNTVLDSMYRPRLPFMMAPICKITFHTMQTLNALALIYFLMNYWVVDEFCQQKTIMKILNHLEWSSFCTRSQLKLVPKKNSQLYYTWTKKVNFVEVSAYSQRDNWPSDSLTTDGLTVSQLTVWQSHNWPSHSLTTDRLTV